MKKLCMLTLFMVIGVFSKAQITYTEKETLRDGVVERLLDADLNVLQEVFTNDDGNITQYYHYNPKTGEKEGEFYDGENFGEINNNLISSPNWRLDITPNGYNTQNSKRLFLTGEVKEGVYNGRYEVIQRIYNIGTQYNPYDSYLLTASTNFTVKLKSYDRWIDYDDYIEYNVGYITFDNGKYVNFNFSFLDITYIEGVETYIPNSGVKFKGEFKDGIIFEYSRTNITTQEPIDFFNTNKKIFRKDGKMYKNQTEYVDLLEGVRKGELSTDTITDLKISNMGVPTILLVDPLNLQYNITSNDYDVDRGMNYNSVKEMKYLSNDYKTIYFNPVNGLRGDYRIGIPTSTNAHPLSYSKKNIPQNLRISVIPTPQSKYQTSSDLYLIWYSYQPNLSEIIKKYGTIKGYEIFNSTLRGDLETIIEVNSGVGFETINNISEVEAIKNTISSNNLINPTLSELQINHDRYGPKIFQLIEVKPNFRNGGMEGFYQYLRENLKLKPKEGEGYPYIIYRFTISDTGEVLDIEIKKKSYNFDEEKWIEYKKDWLDVIENMPKWNPGMDKGVPVYTRIDFRWNRQSFNND